MSFYPRYSIAIAYMIFGLGAIFNRKKMRGFRNKKIIGYIFILYNYFRSHSWLVGKYRTWDKMSVIFLNWNYQIFNMRISLPRRASFIRLVFLYHLLFFISSGEIVERTVRRGNTKRITAVVYLENREVHFESNIVLSKN